MGKYWHKLRPDQPILELKTDDLNRWKQLTSRKRIQYSMGFIIYVILDVTKLL